ncbi:MAG: zinc-ribbon domain-containing protein [Eggerthellaceae bacterium]|nr:zinc-ribbon domain-containing protein [Eggerthellaceae bacterium]
MSAKGVTMYCPNCGRQLRDDDNFCSVCGAPADPNAKLSNESTRPPEPPKRDRTEPGNDGETSKKKSSVPMPVVIAIIVGVVALILILFFVLQGQSGRSAPRSTSSYSASSSASATSMSSGSSSSSSSKSSKSSSSASSSSSKSNSSSSGSITSQPSSASGLGNVRPVQTPDGRLSDDAQQVAIAAGKEVLSGELKMTTFAKRAESVTPKVSGFEKDTTAIALLEVDDETSLCEAVHAGDPSGKPLSGRVETISISMSTKEEKQFWKQLDGQHITVASYPTELMWPSDVSGALYSVTGPCELLAYSG